MIAYIAVIGTKRSFDIEFGYNIPQQLQKHVHAGSRVWIPFGKGDSPREGYVLKVSEGSNDGYKYINSVIDEEYTLTDELLKLAVWMRKRYICTYAESIKCMLPPGSLSKSKSSKSKILRMAALAISYEEAVELLESDKLRSIKQVRVIEILIDNEAVSTADLSRFADASLSVLKTLNKKGIIRFFQKEVFRMPSSDYEDEPDEPLSPTAQQLIVLKELKAVIKRGTHQRYLLHGVTGSGKTEIYMQLIANVIDKGKQAIVLVPEISLTPQAVRRFKARFGSNIAVLHSRLSLGERYDQWRLIQDGKLNVIVGARSAIFAPVSKLGLIIIDEEHEATYKSELPPKYDAREIARYRAVKNKCLLIHATATPSIETYFDVDKGRCKLLEMNKRTNELVLPCVEMVDMRNELENGNKSIFSYKLREEILENIKNGQQTMLLLNRRGHSSFILCRSCGYISKCKNCSLSLKYHESGQRMICHYCGYTYKLPEVCPVCKSKNVKLFGMGTQKLEGEIKNMFPGCSVLRMDADTTNFKNAHEKILNEFVNNNINILIGTQMIAKGHDFPNVTLVGILAADSILGSEDFRAGEKTFQLLTQAAGRSGRGSIKGRVVIQTYNMDNYSITAACMHDYKDFYKQEISFRKNLGYPPFYNIGVAVLKGSNDRKVMAAARYFTKILKTVIKKEKIKIYVGDPMRSPIAMINNNYRWRIVFKCFSIEKTVNILTQAEKDFYKQHQKDVILSLDINPFNML